MIKNFLKMSWIKYYISALVCIFYLDILIQRDRNLNKLQCQNYYLQYLDEKDLNNVGQWCLRNDWFVYQGLLNYKIPPILFWSIHIVILLFNI
jgi:hypothetical protein